VRDYHKNVRLKDYDYSSSGGYFVTIVVAGRECCLSRIDKGNAELTDFGQVVVRGWTWLAEQYSYVVLDEYVIMPNHFHGILFVEDSQTEKGPRLTLGRLIAAFKTVTTREINLARKSPGRQFWQDNFHEHVIRNERDLAGVREYIANNPLQWALDKENPECVKP
jgi:REP element-mobilizing transposase RayT